MILKQVILKIRTDPPMEAHGNSFRGYISHQFPQYDILHGRTKEGKLLYRYPRIQYRVINKEAYIIGLEEGVQIVREIEPKIETVQVQNNCHRIIQKQIFFEEVNFGSLNSMITYSFIRNKLKS